MELGGLSTPPLTGERLSEDPTAGIEHERSNAAPRAPTLGEVDSRLLRFGVGAFTECDKEVSGWAGQDRRDAAPPQFT